MYSLLTASGFFRSCTLSSSSERSLIDVSAKASFGVTGHEADDELGGHQMVQCHADGLDLHLTITDLLKSIRQHGSSIMDIMNCRMTPCMDLNRTQKQHHPKAPKRPPIFLCGSRRLSSA